MKPCYLVFLALLYVCRAENGKQIGAVASENTQSTEVGKMILENGGNAFDAVVAMAYVNGLVESGASGIGGGGFVVLYDAKTQKVRTIDGREEAPEAYHPKVFCLNEDCYLNPDCECTSDEIIGWTDRIPGGLSVGVPGMVAMTRRILEEHGTMTLEEVVAPAIKLAEEGFLASERWVKYHAPLDGYWWVENLQNLGNAETMNYLYNDDGTQKYSVGDTVVNQDYADTLRLLVQDPDSIYTGQLAQEIVDAVKANPNMASGSRPGLMEMSDLAGYKAVEREPLVWEYGEYKIYGHGMCTSGPMTIAMAAKIIESHMGGQIPENAYENEEFIHALISAQNIAWADRNAYMGDNDFSGINVDPLMSDSYLAERAKLIGDMMVQTPVAPGNPTDHMNPTDNPTNDHGTSHLVAMDADGNIASMTSTIEMSFGSGITVPGRGFMLNNQLTDFEGYGLMDDGTLKANAPEGGKKMRVNAINGDENTMGGKRPRSSTSPMLILKNDMPFAGIGGVGGSTIIAAVGNSLFRMMFEGKNVEEAIDAPRIWARGGTADVEEELYDTFAQNLIDNRGYTLNRRVYGPNKYIRIAMGVNIDADGVFHAKGDSKRQPGALGLVAMEKEEEKECIDDIEQLRIWGGVYMNDDLTCEEARETYTCANKGVEAAARTLAEVCCVTCADWVPVEVECECENNVEGVVGGQQNCQCGVIGEEQSCVCEDGKEGLNTGVGCICDFDEGYPVVPKNCIHESTVIAMDVVESGSIVMMRMIPMEENKEFSFGMKNTMNTEVLYLRRDQTWSSIDSEGHTRIHYDSRQGGVYNLETNEEVEAFEFLPDLLYSGCLSELVILDEETCFITSWFACYPIEGGAPVPYGKIHAYIHPATEADWEANTFVTRSCGFDFLNPVNVECQCTAEVRCEVGQHCVEGNTIFDEPCVDACPQDNTRSSGQCICAGNDVCRDQYCYPTDPGLTPECQNSPQAETTEGPEPYVLVDGGHCPEGMNVMDGEECESAAEMLDLMYLAKYEDKTTRAGCFYSPGFSNGVFFNGHPEAPHADDHVEYSSICRLVLPTEEPEQPDCEAACSSDLERLTRQVESNTDDVTYLTQDVPTVLANTFTTVNNLEQLVLSLQAEVERLTSMVNDHHDKFMCLAGSMEMEKEE